MSIGNSSVGRPPIEELGDAEGLLGGWDAKGDTVVQGEVMDSQDTHSSLIPSLHQPPLHSCIVRLGTGSKIMYQKARALEYSYREQTCDIACGSIIQ